MINRLLAVLLIAIGVGISSGVVYGDLKKGYYSPVQLGTIQQAAPQALAPDAAYEVSSYPVPNLDLAPGDGQAEVRIYCSTCHGPRYITMQPTLPAPVWEAEVNKMKKTLGADIPEDATRKIIAYLQSHYTPETRKP